MSWNLAGVDASSGLPKGEFNMRICEAKQAVSKAGNPMINLKLAIVGPKHSKFSVYETFVMNNDIALGRMADMLDKADIPRDSISPEDIQPLLNKIVAGKLIIKKEKRSDTGEEVERVKISSWTKPVELENETESFQ